MALVKHHLASGKDGQIATGATIAEMMRGLGIPDDGVKLMIINGRKAPPDAELDDMEQVACFPPVGGG